MYEKMKGKLTLAPEGGPFVVSSLVAAVICGFIGMWTHQTSFQIVALICTLFAAFCFHFFRDPLRIPPIGNNIILSPADGKVVFVGEVEHDPDLKLLFNKYPSFSLYLMYMSIEFQLKELLNQLIAEKVGFWQRSRKKHQKSTNRQQF
jgi:hypothetical protein